MGRRSRAPRHEACPPRERSSSARAEARIVAR
jgi:hypothetical protein